MTIPAPARAALTVNVTESFADVAALRPQWESLFASGCHEPSTSVEWTAAMVRHHAKPGDRAFCVRLERDGALVGVIPLVLRNFPVMGQRVALLTPLSEYYNTHSALLLQSLDEDVVKAVVSTLFTLNARWDCFRMARLLADNPLLPVLQRALTAQSRSHSVREGLSAYVLDLPSSYETYLAARSAKFRNHLKRKQKQLAGSGHLEVHELEGAGQFEAALEMLMKVERSSWKHSFGTAITSVTRQTGFFEDFGREAALAGRLHLQWMTLDSRPIAYNLGYFTGAGYHYLKTSYDHQFRPMGPATVLRARLIERLIAARVGRLDFPGEPYEWEAQWTDTVRRRVVLSVYAPTIRGRLLSMVERLRHRAARSSEIAHSDPRGKRRAQHDSTEAAA